MWMSWIPLQGLLSKMAQPQVLAAGLGPLIVQVLDFAALCAALAAFVCMVRYVGAPWRSAAAVATWIFGLQTAMISLPDAWSETYAYGRSMTPFWALVAFAGVQQRTWMAVMPLLVISLRTGLQWNSQIKGVLLWILK